MSLPISLFIQDNFKVAKTYFSSKIGQYLGRLVVKIRSGLTSLGNDRVAGGAVFVSNFAILEIASRISQLVGVCLPNQTEEEKSIKSTVEFFVAVSLTIFGNITFVKASGISFNPIVIVAITVETFMVKSGLENYLLD
jgi:hypothetical protein